MFLPGEASESEEENDDDGDEAERKEEQRRVLGNPSAQVSRLDISGVNNVEGHHMVNGGDPGNGTAHDAQPGSGLSAKAGIILVGDSISAVR